MDQWFNIEFRANEGYGDFITGLCYAHASVIKYQQPVHLTLHWPNPKDFLFSDIDTESIFYRYEYILNYLKPVNGLSISHKFSSIPKYRFINELEENNHLHGLWYLKDEPNVQPGLVAFWSSKHNLNFPGIHKDPLYQHWDEVVKNLKAEGYNVVELTYRTPIETVMKVITTCEFGIGYEGMVHQLFKFTWRPLVVAAKRLQLTKLLVPQAKLISEPSELLHTHIQEHVLHSKRNIKNLLKSHSKWLSIYEDPKMHPLYNKEI